MRHEDCPMAVALRENRAIRGIEAIGERPNGTRFPFLPYPTPIRTASGTVEGGINVLVDVTDRKTNSHIRNALISDLEKKRPRYWVWSVRYCGRPNGKRRPPRHRSSLNRRLGA